MLKKFQRCNSCVTFRFFQRFFIVWQTVKVQKFMVIDSEKFVNCNDRKMFLVTKNDKRRNNFLYCTQYLHSNLYNFRGIPREWHTNSFLFLKQEKVRGLKLSYTRGSDTIDNYWNAISSITSTANCFSLKFVSWKCNKTTCYHRHIFRPTVLLKMTFKKMKNSFFFKNFGQSMASSNSNNVANLNKKRSVWL